MTKPSTLLDIRNLNYRRGTDDDLWIIPEIIDQNMFRFDYLATLEPDTESVVLDCGAHIGIFSILSSIYLKKSKIHAFEPQPSNFSLLDQNTQIYRNIISYPVGVGIENTSLKLYRHGSSSEGFTGRWTLTPTTEETSEQMTVSVINLEEFINKIDVPVFILKLDLEGFEAAVLKNLSSNTLSKIKIMILEEHHLPIDHQRLQDEGFSLLFNPLNSDRHFIYFNTNFWKYTFAKYLNKNKQDHSLLSNEIDNLISCFKTSTKDSRAKIDLTEHIVQETKELLDEVTADRNRLWEEVQYWYKESQSKQSQLITSQQELERIKLNSSKLLTKVNDYSKNRYTQHWGHMLKQLCKKFLSIYR
jgi:FkbM family methyltransferase